MQRNRNDYYSNIPTPHMPRYKRDLGVHSRIQTFKHGHLIPFYSRFVYPHSNLRIDSTAFIRMDTSLKVPMDDIFLDTYFFFIPLRIIDPKFEKILGYKTAYDTNDYFFPTMKIDANSHDPLTHDSLFQYFGWQASNDLDDSLGYLKAVKLTSDPTKFSGGYTTGINLDVVNTYQLAAYYVVYNQYFRDETLDSEIPISMLLSSINPSRLQLMSSSGGALFKGFNVLPVNRNHDIFSSGIITPTGVQGDVKIPLGVGYAPVGWIPSATISAGSGNITTPASTANEFNQLSISAYSSGVSATSKLWADVNSVAPSIQQLYLSMALYSLYDKRGTFGSRLIEQIRGSFGLEVPDGLVDRAEYLGGSCQTLNNTPVLNTADDLGEMRGNSATLVPVTSFDKGFNEWGFVIGVCCTRVKHTYSQGISNPAWKIFDSLDMYWPEFANVGKFGTPNYRIVNNPDSTLVPNNENFNFTDAWIDQETEIDIAAGDFGSLRHAAVSELQTKWSYQDIYGISPTFSATWLKEPMENITRTLSGLIIPNSADANDGQLTSDGEYLVGGHQFLIQHKYRVQLTLAKPPRSKVPNITGRI